MITFFAARDDVLYFLKSFEANDFFRFLDVIFMYDKDDFINAFMFFECMKRVCQYGFPGNYDELFG